MTLTPRDYDILTNRVDDLRRDLLKSLLVIAAGFDGIRQFTNPPALTEQLTYVSRGLDEVIRSLTPPED